MRWDFKRSWSRHIQFTFSQHAAVRYILILSANIFRISVVCFSRVFPIHCYFLVSLFRSACSNHPNTIDFSNPTLAVYFLPQEKETIFHSDRTGKIHTLICCKIPFNIILLPTSVSSKWSLPFAFWSEFYMPFLYPPYILQVCPLSSSWIDHPNIFWRVEIMRKDFNTFLQFWFGVKTD
jgi:hypothetical protein